MSRFQYYFDGLWVDCCIIRAHVAAVSILSSSARSILDDPDYFSNSSDASGIGQLVIPDPSQYVPVTHPAHANSGCQCSQSYALLPWLDPDLAVTNATKPNHGSTTRFCYATIWHLKPNPDQYGHATTTYRFSVQNDFQDEERCHERSPASTEKEDDVALDAGPVEAKKICRKIRLEKQEV